MHLPDHYICQIVMVPTHSCIHNNHAVTTTGSRVLDDSILQIEMQIQNVCLIGSVEKSTLKPQVSIQTVFMLQRKGAFILNENECETKFLLIFASSQYEQDIEFSNPFKSTITFAFALIQYKCTLSRGLNVKTLNLKESHLQEGQCDSHQFCYQHIGK